MSKSATTNNTTKRYDGEGTVNQRKDGRWEYRVSLGKVNGKYAYKSFYAATERELKKLIKQYNSDRQKYLCEADKTPFWQHAEHWMRVYKFPNLRGNSIDRLETTYEVHIKPVLGFLPLSQINSDDIQMLINAKAQELSYSYIKKIYEFLNGFFKYAKQRGIITTNPCDAVIVPKEEHVAVKTREIDILTPKEISKLYAFNNKILKNDNHFYKHVPAYLFLLNTGIRCGEAIALEWSDIDFENRICRINKNFTLVKSRDKNWNAGKRQKLVSETKTPAGVREIPLNDRAVEMLEQIQNYNRKRGIETPYVISTDSGAQISERSLFQSLEYALGAAEIHHIGLHGLRHPYVKHTTKIFSLRLMDFQAQAYPDARRKTRGACQLLRVGQSRSPVRPLCNRKRFSCLPPQSKMSWILYAISMRLSGYTSTRSISNSASSVVSVSASKIALDASLGLSCRACSSCFFFACANTAA